MKRLLSIILLIAMSLGAVFAQQPASSFCHIVITGDFDSECFYNFKDDITDEYPNLMIACKNSTVTYTAYANLGAATPANYIWEIYGDVTHTATGNQVTVDWGGNDWGYVVVSVTDGLGDTCTELSRVRLIDKPTVGSTTVPAYVTMPDGTKVIRVCEGGTVQFIDQSTASGSDIAGYLWDYDQGIQASTPNFVLEDVIAEGTVTHRVYNNCGCYDEETYSIELLHGDVLELACYGTVCENDTVTYRAISPTCQDYQWYVEGGTIIGGQGTATPTVQWDNPTDGYGVIGLDGILCGDLVCPTLMTRKVPVIQDGLHIKGQTNVCVGEVVKYSLPLLGSTEYRWEITPVAGVDTSLKTDASEMSLRFTQQGTYTLTCRYRCDFLGCGPYSADTLTIVVKPELTITGLEEICVSNACSLQVTPAVSAAWTAYDLAGGNAVAATGTGTTFSHTFTHAGRYLVTAAHPDYCSQSSFVLNVRATPPAPTIGDLDPANRHTACIYSGIALGGTPSQPNYRLVWEPACTTASPQNYSGDSVTISYRNEVCDVRVYNFDMVLQCRSTDYYVHTVDEFEPEPLNIPQNITVCPGTVINWNDDNVPDQSFEGMLYRWSIENFKQYCASVQGSHLTNSITLAVNEIQPPETFYVALERRYCGNMHADTIIPITVKDTVMPPPTISGADEVCVGSSATYTGSGGNPATYRWEIEDGRYSGNPATHLFHNVGLQTVTLRGSAYTYASGSCTLSTATKQVTVKPLPAVGGLAYDNALNKIVTVPPLSPADYTFEWYKDDVEGQPPIFLGTGANVTPWPALSPYGNYWCIVTEIATGCSKTVYLWYTGSDSGDNCDTINLASSYDYCNRILSLEVNNPSIKVRWTVEGGSYSIETSGTNDRHADITLYDVGTYTVTATVPGINCKKGVFVKNVDFIPNLTYEPECTYIRIVNHSRYTGTAETMFIEVTNSCDNYVGLIQMPVVDPSYVYVPTPAPTCTCTYYFRLIGYGIIHPANAQCPLGSVTIGSPPVPPGESPVYIETANYPYNTTCNNTPINLTANLNYDGSIRSSFWNFGDNSTYHTYGDHIYHTFKSPMLYNVTVSVTDNYGCTRTTQTPYSISSAIDILTDGLLQLYPGPNVCPNGNSRDIYFTPHYSNNQYTWWRHKDLTLRPSVYDEHYYTYRSDDYFVYVIDNNYCQKEAAINVTFRNAPTAIIYAKNFNCCEGDEITLYGKQDPDATIRYSWTITGPNGFSQSSAEPNVTFTAPHVTGSYTVTLTVTDQNTTCSSTATETVTVNAKPAAPTIAFTGSPCLSDAPVEIAATGFTGELHWNNGNTGTPANYYTHGMASAYYYDPAIGCASDTAKIRIDRQPDFDALLTGCYRKCSDFFDYYLPVWGLTDYGQEIEWSWLHNNSTLTYGHGDYYHTPLRLLLHSTGDYRLKVTYGGGNCIETSPTLSIGTKELCDCDSIEVTYKRTMTVVDCKVYYTLTVTICNNHSESNFCPSTFVPMLTNPNFTVVSTDFVATTIAPNDCYTFNVVIEATSLEPSVATFTLSDPSCLLCTKNVSFDLMPEITCEEEMESVDVEINTDLTNHAAAYFGFVCDVGDVDRVLAFWTEPPMVVDWLFDGYTLVEGLGMIDINKLTQLLWQDSVICFYAITCTEDQLCKKHICIHADELYDLIVNTGVLEGWMRRHKQHDGAEMDSLSVPDAGLWLSPNPTSGKVTVKGAAGDVAEIVVMDMNGRKLAVFTDTETFDVSDLPSGSYIIRVKTGNDNKITYHKLIKQ